MDPEDQNSLKRERFVAELSASQNLLFRYIFSLLPNSSMADDVLQETNIVLWRKVDEFDESQGFLPWARAIARYQVLASRRDQSRDRIVFDENLVNLIADEFESDHRPDHSQMNALELCLTKLSSKNRELILRRYSSGTSVEGIAKSLKRPVASISQALYRIRQSLMKCVEKQSLRQS